MSPESFNLKVTAILSADVKGYSCFVGENAFRYCGCLKLGRAWGIP